MIDIDTDTVTAASTFFLAIGTLVLMYRQNRQAREINSASSIMALRERFDAPHLRRARKQLAGRLLAHQHDDITNLEVGSFFELVGTLTRRRVLDEELVWEAFGSWISAYYWALRHPVDVIGLGREKLHDPQIWHEFEWLDGRIQSLDVHATGLAPADGTRRESDSRVLLQIESALDLTDG